MKVGIINITGYAGSELARILYRHPEVAKMAGRAEPVLGELWEAFRASPDTIPERARRGTAGEPAERALADYLAGMTDRFAMAEHFRLTGREL